MKRIYLFMLLMTLLTSCGTIRNGIISVNRPAARLGDPAARYRIAATDIKRYFDRNTGAQVQASTYSRYTFWVQFGTVRVENSTGGAITVYRYNPHSGGWDYETSVYRYGDMVEVITQTNRVRQLLRFMPSGHEIYLQVYAGGRKLQTFVF